MSNHQGTEQALQVIKDAISSYSNYGVTTNPNAIGVDNLSRYFESLGGELVSSEIIDDKLHIRFSFPAILRYDLTIDGAKPMQQDVENFELSELFKEG